MKKQKCVDCFYSRWDKVEKETLWCLRYPPVPTIDGDMNPIVKCGHWCGEWKDKDFIAIMCETKIKSRL